MHHALPFISSPTKRTRTFPKPLLASMISYRLPFRVSDVVAFAVVKALPLPCAIVDFRTFDLLVHFSFLPALYLSILEVRLPSRTCSGYSFHKFVTWAFSIIRDDGLSSLCDHILHLPVKLRSCRLQFWFQCFNFTPASIFTLFSFLPASTGLTVFLFLPPSSGPSCRSLNIVAPAFDFGFDLDSRTEPNYST